MAKNKKIEVQGKEITIILDKEQEYISLTDMLKAKDGDFFISDWLRNRNTVEYLGIWETVYNPDFNYGEFATIKSQAGLNSYKLSVKEWVQKTNAIGLKATTGRYGGTYAHPDIAFEFGMWISPQFKIYLVKEFQRLKNAENDRLKLDWNLQRTLAKVNYQIHTDAIKENLIPNEITKQQASYVYANEADLLNVALFGITAKEWREANLELKGNIRDFATLEQLVVLSNMESINALLIRQNLPQSERLIQLNKVAITKMKSLLESNTMRKLKSTQKQKYYELKTNHRSFKTSTRNESVDGPHAPKPRTEYGYARNSCVHCRKVEIVGIRRGRRRWRNGHCSLLDRWRRTESHRDACRF